MENKVKVISKKAWALINPKGEIFDVYWTKKQAIGFRENDQRVVRVEIKRAS